MDGSAKWLEPHVVGEIAVFQGNRFYRTTARPTCVQRLDGTFQIKGNWLYVQGKSNEDCGKFAYIPNTEDEIRIEDSEPRELKIRNGFPDSRCGSDENTESIYTRLEPQLS